LRCPDNAIGRAWFPRRNVTWLADDATKQALVLFSSRVEHRFGFAVIAAETEFREERDSRRSRSSAVTPIAVAISHQQEAT